MAEAITVSGPIIGHRQDPDLRDRQARTSSPRAPSSPRIGDTIVLVTANAAKGVREGIDFFPLTVDVEERMYAAGKIPGSFFRREGRPTDHAILNCRLIDRPLRPSFADGFRNETQVVVTVIGADKENPHDVLAINAASAALMLSRHPVRRPDRRRAHRVHAGRHLDPAPDLRGGRRVDLRARRRRPCRSSGDIAIMMVEAGGTEKASEYYDGGAPKVTEEVIAEGLEECKTGSASRSTCSASSSSRPARARRSSVRADARLHRRDLRAGRRDRHATRSPRRSTIADKAERNAATDAATASIIEQLCGEGAPFEGRERQVKAAVRSLHEEARPQAHRRGGRPHRRPRPDRHPPAVRRGRRHPDGARLRPVPAGRDPGAQRAAPSACRRWTSCSTPSRPKTKKRYMHHYNMPPHANGETGRVGQPEAPRDRPRPARRAGAAAGRAEQGGVPLHAAPRVRGAGVQRLDLDGLGVLRRRCR